MYGVDLEKLYIRKGKTCMLQNVILDVTIDRNVSKQ